MNAKSHDKLPPGDVDFKDGTREIDPVTGYDTTGHLWNGIRELNTPFPRIVFFFLAITFIYSVIAWILLPAWPVAGHYTPGVLGLTQQGKAVEGFVALKRDRHDWMKDFDQPDFVALEGDPTVLAAAIPAAHRLFEDNCAVCHGRTANGARGYPNLADGYWLWGGDPETVAETIAVGINSTNEDTRISQMPSFAGLEPAERRQLAGYVVALRSGNATGDDAGAALFTDNCAACHGDDASGGLDNGAPSLTDKSVIYGQDTDTVLTTLEHGRSGVMPAWSNRLSRAEINLLALYVTRLQQAARANAQ